MQKRDLIQANASLENLRQNLDMKDFAKEILLEENYNKFIRSYKFQLCAQLRVCSQAGGIPVYPRFSQPDNSESWDDAGNGI